MGRFKYGEEVQKRKTIMRKKKKKQKQLYIYMSTYRKSKQKNKKSKKKTQSNLKIISARTDRAHYGDSMDGVGKASRQ